MTDIDVLNFKSCAENNDENDQEKTRKRNDWILLQFLSQFLIFNEEKEIEKIQIDKCDHHV